MKTLTEVERINDLDSRVINAARLLELELRRVMKKTKDNTVTLGKLVQEQAKFQKNGFIRDVNFSLGIRNSIAHGDFNGREPRDDEKSRAAGYLLQAVRLVRGDSTGQAKPKKKKKSNSAPRKSGKVVPTRNRSSKPDRFDSGKTRAAIERIYETRRSIGAGAAIVTFLAVIVGTLMLDGLVPFGVGFIGAGVAAVIAFAIIGLNRKLSSHQYYSLPGSRYSNGDHRCIHCSNRGANGRGIYIHRAGDSPTRHHDCTNCRKLLFTS